MPPHADDDDDVIIILSVVISPELAECLDRKVAAGPFGASREEVAQLYLCNAFGVTMPPKQVPIQDPVVSEDAKTDPAADNAE